MSDSTTARHVPCSFAQFLVSLGSSALVHLGEITDPGTGKAHVDLTLARHSIDVLQLLKGKTEGNLDEDEGRLLDALLADLNQKFGTAQG
jgi:hypothetical protein